MKILRWLYAHRPGRRHVLGMAVLLSYACGMSPTDPRQLVPYLPTFELDRPDFASYPAMTTQLQLIARDSSGLPITGLQESWRSSARSVATVDTKGLVTAVAPGTAVISATTQERSASVTITVLPRPVADWSNAAADWITFQGGPAHTGFVPVTPDPVSFRTAWSAAVSPGYAIWGTAAGAGMLIVSTSKPLRQIVVGLDAQTGVERWSAEAGVADMLSPPTIASNTVFVQTGFGDARVWAFDAATGALKKAVGAAGDANGSGSWGPVFVGNQLYAAFGGFGGSGVRSLNAADLSQAWLTDLLYGPPTPTIIDGSIYAYDGRRLFVLDAATGARSYDIPDGTEHEGPIGVPVAASAHDVIAAKTGARSDRRLICFDLQNRAVRWSVSGRFESQVTVANGVVYIYNEPQYPTGARYLEAYRLSDGVLLWRWTPRRGLLQGRIVATNNLVFVTTGSTDAATYAVDINTHLEAWSHPVSGVLTLSTQGYLFISQQNGTITAIGLK